MYYTLENFIDYCENNDVATEGLFSKFKDKNERMNKLSNMDIKQLIKFIPKYMESKNKYARSFSSGENHIIETMNLGEPGKLLSRNRVGNYYVKIMEEQGDSAKYLKDPITLYVSYFDKNSDKDKGVLPKFEVVSKRELMRFIVDNHLM